MLREFLLRRCRDRQIVVENDGARRVVPWSMARIWERMAGHTQRKTAIA